MTPSPLKQQALIDQILNSKKYRHLGLNRATICDLIHREGQKQPSHKAVSKAVRRKLHNIVAPYLGEPDYARLSERLSQITGQRPQSEAIKTFCLEVLSEHASTAERIPHMNTFYDQLFQITGKPDVLLDLACGLHPLALPWMNLSSNLQYHAYDIIQVRVEFINQFFQTINLTPNAENRDILINPPRRQADLALFLKEAHRFEKRQPGCNRKFWESLRVDTLVVSLPVQDLSGTHNLIDHHRELVQKNLPTNRSLTELIIENEILFIIN